MAEVTRPEKYSAIWMADAIRLKKYPSVWTAEVYNLEKCSIGKKLKSSMDMAIGIWSDLAFLDALDLYKYHTFLQNISLLAYTSKVLLCRCQEVCHFFQFSWVVSNLGITVTLNIKMLILESAPSHFHQAVNVTLNINPVSKKKPTNKSYCYKTDENNNYKPTKSWKPYCYLLSYFVCE